MFDFRKVRKVANLLAKIDGEEYNRSAIIRYYYSLFCCVRLYLIIVMGETNFSKGKHVHSRICDRLKESNDSTEYSLGKRLEKLRDLRNLADYDWYEKDSEYFRINVNFARKESEIGLQQVEILKKSPPFEI